MRHPLLGLLLVACAGPAKEPVDGDDPSDPTTDAATDTPSDPVTDGTDAVTDAPSDVDDDTGPTDPPLPPPVPPTTLGPGFVEVPAPGLAASGLYVAQGDRSVRFPPANTSALFADLDGDGLPELFYLQIEGGPPPVQTETMHVLTYDPATSELSLSTPLRALLPITPNPSRIVGAVDLDGDGALDLLTNDAEGAFVWGDGAGAFLEPEPVPLPLRGYPRLNTAALADVDGDGWLDVVFAPGGCGDEGLDVGLLLRSGPRSYADKTALLPDVPLVDPYAVLAAPVGDSILIHPAGRPCDPGAIPSGFYRTDGIDADGWPTFDVSDPTSPASFYKQGNTGSTGYMPAYQPMAAVVADFDGDQEPDLLSSVSYQLMLLFQGGTSWPLDDLTLHAVLDNPLLPNGPLPGSPYDALLPWGVAAVDVDRDGAVDVVTVHGDDATAWYDELLPPQWTTAHWNRGDGSFESITDITGLDALGEYRSLTVGDLDRDGDPDLILGGQAMFPRVMRNDVDTGTSLGIVLSGSTSNHLGIGARVRVWSTDVIHPPTQVMGAMGAPLAISEPIVFAGLGQATEASRVRVTWPSGLVQEVQHLAAGQVHVIEEPPTLVLDTDTRHVPADGSSTVTVSVTPRDLSGQPRAGAVTIELKAGAGTWAGPVFQDGDSWRRTLIAPAYTADAVVEATIDGTPLAVRPRIWWDG